MYKLIVLKECILCKTINLDVEFLYVFFVQF